MYHVLDFEELDFSKDTRLQGLETIMAVLEILLTTFNIHLITQSVSSNSMKTHFIVFKFPFCFCAITKKF